MLQTRTIAYHLSAVPPPLSVVQILYRTTDAQGRPSANVTSVVKAPLAMSSNVVAYQSFYDSLTPEDSPSRAIAGGTSGGASIANVETGLIMMITGAPWPASTARAARPCATSSTT